jgi:hypothetical protein
MGIDKDAESDLSLTDEDAESVAGGKKTKKVAVKHPAAKTYPVAVVGTSVVTIDTSVSTDTPDDDPNDC